MTLTSARQVVTQIPTFVSMCLNSPWLLSFSEQLFFRMYGFPCNSSSMKRHVTVYHLYIVVITSLDLLSGTPDVVSEVVNARS